MLLRIITGGTQIAGYYTQPQNMIVYARGGNDNISMSNVTARAEFYGEAGDDFLTGSSRRRLARRRLRQRSDQRQRRQ